MKKLLLLVSIMLFVPIAQSNNSEELDSLWYFLDTNIDGQISKEEAISSKEVFKNWHRLDTNKNENLDSKEFARIFSHQK